MKKSYKKYQALYLSVAFFFVFFSFGISTAHADTAVNISISSSGLWTNFSTAMGAATGGATSGTALNKYYGLYPATTCLLGNTGSFNFTSFDGADLNNNFLPNYGNECSGQAAPSTYDEWWSMTVGGVVYYAQAYRVSGVWSSTPPPPPDTSTRFISFTVNQSAGTVLATGYWNASATSSQSQELRFWQVTPALGQESYASRIATTSGNFSFTFPYLDSSFQISATSTSYTLGTGVTFYGEIYQLYDGFNPFSNTGTPPLLLTSTSTSITATSSVTVDSSNPRSLSGLPEPADCSLSAITGCIKNAAVWLFYPSSDSVDSFKGLSDTLSGKFPFAYAYGINTMRLELFEAAQTSTTTISLNFKIIPGHATSTLTLLSPTLLSNVPYSSTVKTILSWILWLLGIEYIYYRVLRSHDPNTPS